MPSSSQALFGLASTRLPRPLAAAVNRLLQIDKLERLYQNARGGSEFARELLDKLDVDVQVSNSDLARIPATGGVIAVSNHPFGLLDGAVLGHLLSRVRSDLRVLTSRMLGELPELARICFFVDPFDRLESRVSNSRGLKQAIAHVRNGGLLLIFPAGEVAHFDFRAGSIRDPEWRSTTARLARITGAKVVPVLIRGANSLPFQMLGMVHPRLRTAALPSEMLNKRGRQVEVRIGNALLPVHLKTLPDDETMIRYIRLRCDLLARRAGKSAMVAPSTFGFVAPGISSAAIAREIGDLPKECLLETARNLDVYLTEAAQIPLVLEEIGRLREVTFRATGEGTGKMSDIDRFDLHYKHLFVWNREKQEIVGAYRMGDVAQILARFGRKGLYTDSLFRFRPGFLEKMGPALEMGRSFIRPEYQRQYTPLLLLWKGIGAYVSRHPEHALLIGAVSVSNQYSQASRHLIVRYFEQHAPVADHGAVKARRPLHGNLIEKWEMQALCSLLPDVEDLSAPIADLEADGKGIPILVKQYVKLGGHLLAFSVDPQFSNCLDGFVMVDLRLTQPEILSRYMSREGVQKVRACAESLQLPSTVQ